MSRRRKQRRETKEAPKVRNHQTATQKRPVVLGWLAKGSLGLLVVLLVVLLGSYLWIRSYLRSDDFRVELGQQIGSAAGGNATVGEIDWHGSEMEMSSLSLLSPKSGDWEIQQVSTEIDFNGIWNSTWLIPKIEIGSAQSHWDFRTTEKNAVSSSSKARDSASGGSRKKGSGLLPTRTEIHELKIRNYAGKVLLDQGPYTWNGTTLTCQPRPQVTNVVSLKGGRLQTPHSWLPSLDLQSGILGLSENGIELSFSEWTGDHFDHLELSGEIAPESRSLSALFEGWEARSFIPIEWHSIFSGRLSGGLDWHQNSESPAGASQSKIVLKEGVLKGLPFLDRLAAYSGNARLQRLSFEEAKATILKEGDTWSIKDLVLFDEGLLRVEGAVEIRAKALSGQLQVGVPPGLLAHIPGAEEKVFLPGKNGLLWTPVQISGTWENPKEDLSERMIRAAGERMFEMIPETGKWALRYTGQAMDQGTALLLENQDLILEQGTKVAEEVIEQGGNAVEEGLKTGFGILNGILGGDDE